MISNQLGIEELYPKPFWSHIYNVNWIILCSLSTRNIEVAQKGSHAGCIDCSLLYEAKTKGIILVFGSFNKREDYVERRN